MPLMPWASCYHGHSEALYKVKWSKLSTCVALYNEDMFCISLSACTLHNALRYSTCTRDRQKVFHGALDQDIDWPTQLCCLWSQNLELIALRLPELSLSSFKRQLKTHMALPALVYWLQLFLVHTIVWCCCEFGADYECPNSSQLTALNALSVLQLATVFFSNNTWLSYCQNLIAPWCVQWCIASLQQVVFNADFCNHLKWTSKTIICDL